MDALLATVAEAQGGVFTRAQALAAGYSRRDVTLHLRHGEWVRVRRGVYIARCLADSLDATGRYVADIHAVMLAVCNRGVVSHTSAAALHGLPLWGVDTSLVHLTRPCIRGGRLEAGVDHHRGVIRPDDVVRRDGLLVTAAPQAVVESASIVPYEAGVVLADAALAAQVVDADELCAALDSMRSWPGSRKAGRVVSFADGRSESPGESRLRVLFRHERLPLPELQAPIRDSAGDLVGRVDFLFTEYDTIVEFDGMMKYGLGSASAADDLFREKRREDRLRELGYEVVRIVWVDLVDGSRVAARVRAAMMRQRARQPSVSRIG